MAISVPAYLNYLLDCDLGNVDEQHCVVSVGRDADELVRVRVDQPVVPVGVAQPEEGGAVREAVARHVRRGDEVVAVAEESAEQAAEDHLDQRHVLLADGRAVARGAAPAAAAAAAVAAVRAAAVEVGAVKQHVVDVEAAREADLIVLEERYSNLTRCMH